MSEALTPNPYSPYADADPNYRHLIPNPFALIGASLTSGKLTPAACGGMTVVPEGLMGDLTDNLREGRTDDLPPGLCPFCVAVVTGRGDGMPLNTGTCTVCDSGSSHGDLCAMCRQELHDICRDPAAALQDQVTMSISDALRRDENVSRIAEEALAIGIVRPVKRLADDLIAARQEVARLQGLLTDDPGDLADLIAEALYVAAEPDSRASGPDDPIKFVGAAATTTWIEGTTKQIADTAMTVVGPVVNRLQAEGGAECKCGFRAPELGPHPDCPVHGAAVPATGRSWKDIDPKDATDLNLAEDLSIDAPLNEMGERCPWPWEPQQLGGVPMGQYHCRHCGAMCVAGVPHPDYRDVPDGPEDGEIADA